MKTTILKFSLYRVTLGNLNEFLSTSCITNLSFLGSQEDGAPYSEYFFIYFCLLLNHSPSIWSNLTHNLIHMFHVTVCSDFIIGLACLRWKYAHLITFHLYLYLLSLDLNFKLLLKFIELNPQVEQYLAEYITKPLNPPSSLLAPSGAKSGRPLQRRMSVKGAIKKTRSIICTDGNIKHYSTFHKFSNNLFRIITCIRSYVVVLASCETKPVTEQKRARSSSPEDWPMVKSSSSKLK